MIACGPLASVRNWHLGHWWSEVQCSSKHRVGYHEVDGHARLSTFDHFSLETFRPKKFGCILCANQRFVLDKSDYGTRIADSLCERGRGIIDDCAVPHDQSQDAV